MICVSANFISCVDATGKKILVFPINTTGRAQHPLPTIHAHTEAVTDSCFSYARANELLTASKDKTVSYLVLSHYPNSISAYYSIFLFSISRSRSGKFQRMAY